MDPSRVRNIDLFASLGDDEVERVAAMATEVSVEEGEELVRAGTSPYQLFAIEEGEVEVRRDGESLATVRAGDVVGERGVVKGGLRNASVVAKTSVRALFFTSDQVRQLRRDLPELDEKLRSVLEEREG